MPVSAFSPCTDPRTLPDTVSALARTLSLPAPVRDALTGLCPRLPWESLAPRIPALCDARTAPEEQKALAVLLAPMEDGSGLAQLAVHLAAADRAHQMYRTAGVGEAVFLQTMGCFSRFLSETYANTGKWMFDRAFWTWRQTACRLFRLGALEFEYRTAGGMAPPGVLAEDAVLSVHIPSDAQLTTEALAASYAQMRGFFSREGAAFCTQGAPKTAVCGTWLLAPALTALLPACSGIRRFASDYALYAIDADDTGFYHWLFGGYAPSDALPGRTSLQRAVRTHLMHGGKIGSACGVLRCFDAPGGSRAM